MMLRSGGGTEGASRAAAALADLARAELFDVVVDALGEAVAKDGMPRWGAITWLS